jgi:hypothetical protein
MGRIAALLEFPLARAEGQLYKRSMATMTFKQFRNMPGKFEPLIKGGQTVRVTKRGKPFFDAVPPKRQSGLRDFFRRVEEVWAGSEVECSTSDLMAGLRESRE